MVLQAAMAFLTDKTDYTHISTALTSNCNSLVSLLWWKKCISLHYRYTSFTSHKNINASSGVIWNLMFEGEMPSFNFATDPSLFSPSLGSKGWRSGESTRLSLIWPGFKSQRRRLMWVEFVVGSLLFSERFFSGYSSFPLSPKTTFPNFNSTRNQVGEEPLCGCATSKSLFILFYLYMKAKLYPDTNSYICYDETGLKSGELGIP